MTGNDDGEGPKRREWSPSEVRAWQDRLPPFEPGPAVPFDYSAKACAVDRRDRWVRDLLWANGEAGVDVAMRAELRDRIRRKG
jgi:hypothetical protein